MPKYYVTEKGKAEFEGSDISELLPATPEELQKLVPQYSLDVIKASLLLMERFGYVRKGGRTEPEGSIPSDRTERRGGDEASSDVLNAEADMSTYLFPK